MRTAWKSRPALLLKAPGTFSHTMYLGFRPCVFSLISLMIRIASRNSPDRSPLSPCRRPATLKSWHGLPKVTMSTGSISLPLISVMLPKCFMSGNRLVVTRIGNGSISEAHRGVIPAIVPARGNPPAPSKSEPNVIIPVSSFLRVLRPVTSRRCARACLPWRGSLSPLRRPASPAIPTAVRLCGCLLSRSFSIPSTSG